MKAVEVLLIEDNAGDTLLIRQVLADCSTPIQLHVARDGEQALLMLTDPSLKPDLILLDLNIPRISGLTLLEQWKSMNMPVVVFSSSTDEGERRRALLLGAREFVSKPLGFEEFTSAVCGIVRKWAVPQAVQSCAG
jgi:two-component system, chemotaxis family, response regulator Rcp1